MDDYTARHGLPHRPTNRRDQDGGEAIDVTEIQRPTDSIGVYEVSVVIDAQFCTETFTQSYEVVDIPENLLGEPIGFDPLCFGGSDGAIELPELGVGSLSY